MFSQLHHLYQKTTEVKNIKTPNQIKIIFYLPPPCLFVILNATHEKQAHNLVFSVAKRIGKGASLFKSIISGISSKVDQLGGSFIYFK